MARKRLLVVVTFAVILGVVTSGADAGRSGTQKASGTQKTIVVGITAYPFTIPALADARRGAIAQAKKMGVKLVFATAIDGPSQIQAVENLLAKNVDVIAIDPNDSASIVPAVKEANKKGVPVITWIGDAAGGKVTSFVASDETLGGFKISTWVFKKLGGKGKVALLTSDPNHQAVKRRNDGFNKALKNFPNITKSAFVSAGGWTEDVAIPATENLLAAHSDLDAIVTVGDPTAIGAYKVASERGLEKKLIITGYNSDCAAVQALLKDQMSASLFQPFAVIGAKVVELSVAAAKSQPGPRVAYVPTMVVTPSIVKAIRGGNTTSVPKGPLRENLVSVVKKAQGGCRY